MKLPSNQLDIHHKTNLAMQCLLTGLFMNGKSGIKSFAISKTLNPGGREFPF